MSPQASPGCACSLRGLPPEQEHSTEFCEARPGVTAGVKHDRGKDRWDLLPSGSARELVQVLTFGAAKYHPDNWRKVPDARARYYAAAMRHLAAWRDGEQLDEESGLPHLAHALCCIVFLRELDRAGLG